MGGGCLLLQPLDSVSAGGKKAESAVRQSRYRASASGRLCPAEVSAMVTPSKLHHETATCISLKDRRRPFREIGEADLFDHLIGQTFGQKVCQALPGALSSVWGAIDRVDADQRHAPNDEGQHRGWQIPSCNQANGRDRAV